MSKTGISINANSSRLFEDDSLQSLWNEAFMADSDWRRARNAVKAREREDSLLI